MKVLVTGANGQLGSDILKILNSRNIESRGIHSYDFDLTDTKFTSEYIKSYAPDIVIHCAAYTNVDQAEVEIDKCWNINAIATANLAKVCNHLDAKIVYISTDYVFSGESTVPYEVDSPPFPLSEYGKSKYAGEKEIAKLTDKYFIVRTSWSFGVNGKNFVNTMLELSKQHSVIDVVADQYGSPTYTIDLAQLIIEMMLTDKYGVYHATNEGYCSWAEFAAEIFRQAGCSSKVSYISTDQYPVKAVRPKNSCLSKSSLDQSGFTRLPSWQDALKRYLNELSIYSNN